MPGLAVREYECTLCQQRFTLLSGDLILPGPRLCDQCLRDVWELEGEALAKHAAGCLAGRDKTPVDNIVRHLKGLKVQWKSVEEAIQARERQRGALE
jgi:hypothetical protein